MPIAAPIITSDCTNYALHINLRVQYNLSILVSSDQPPSRYGYLLYRDYKMKNFLCRYGIAIQYDQIIVSGYIEKKPHQVAPLFLIMTFSASIFASCFALARSALICSRLSHTIC